MGSPKPLGIIKPNVPSKLRKNVDGKWNQANGNAMQGNPLIVRSCKEPIKRPETCPPSHRSSSCTVDHDENDVESNEGVFYHSSFPLPSLSARRQRWALPVVQRVTGPKKPSKQRRARKKWGRSVPRNGQPINDGFDEC